MYSFLPLFYSWCETLPTLPPRATQTFRCSFYLGVSFVYIGCSFSALRTYLLSFLVVDVLYLLTCDKTITTAAAAPAAAAAALLPI